jgi:predicted alpha/beta hydrolase family esterase
LSERSFLILHGWQGPGPDHWYTWLAERLRASGETVALPALPDTDRPRLQRWQPVLEEELAALSGERIVLCHSLGAVLWLHHVTEHESPDPFAERVLLVAPPSPAVSEPELRSFFPVPLDAGAVRRSAAGGTRLVCSDNDPYCPEGAASAYGEPLELPVDVLAGEGHLNPDSGHGPWPEVEAWARGERDELTD